MTKLYVSKHVESVDTDIVERLEKKEGVQYIVVRGYGITEYDWAQHVQGKGYEDTYTAYEHDVVYEMWTKTQKEVAIQNGNHNLSDVIGDLQKVCDAYNLMVTVSSDAEKTTMTIDFRTHNDGLKNLGVEKIVEGDC